MDTGEWLCGIEVRPVAALLRDMAHSDTLDEFSWARVREELRQRSCGVLPRFLPPVATASVLVHPLDDGAVSRVLWAAAELAEEGGEQAAQGLAVACRSLASLTTAPPLRHYRASAPVPGASPRALLDHRVGTEGNGYLAMPATEALNALELGDRSPRPRDGIFPLPPYDAAAWVLVRHGAHSAVGILLAGIQDAYSHPQVGAEGLMSCLRTAAAACRPGPVGLEWDPRR